MSDVYRAEREEYCGAVMSMNEMDRAVTAISVRSSVGLCGDLGDVRYGGGDYR
jgi:hypothetical protein